MGAEKQNRILAKSQQPQRQRVCSECGARMVEVDRRSEGETLFVWYECSKKDCDGQWLQKVEQKSLNNSSSGKS